MVRINKGGGKDVVIAVNRNVWFSIQEKYAEELRLGLNAYMANKDNITKVKVVGDQITDDRKGGIPISNG